MRVRVVVFNATFTNISVILWRSDFFVEKTGRTQEKHRPAANHRQNLSHNGPFGVLREKKTVGGSFYLYL
jgi:hypothetical protein